MGIKIPTPPGDFGNDCLQCSPPVGSRWPTGETPFNVYAYFWSMNACPLGVNSPPNGKTFELHQSTANPCDFWHVGSLWQVNFWTGITGFALSRLNLWDSAGRPHFIGHSVACPPEYQAYANENIICSPVIESVSGFGIIFWLRIAFDIVSDYNLPTHSQLMYEVMMKNDTIPVHKFCNQEKSLNLKFEIP